MAMAKRAGSLRSRHVMTNHIVDVLDDSRAEGVTYLTLYRQVGEEAPGPEEILPLEGPAAIGHYTDEYVRTPDGWRFQSRVLTFSFLNKAAFPQRR